MVASILSLLHRLILLGIFIITTLSHYPSSVQAGHSSGSAVSILGTPMKEVRVLRDRLHHILNRLDGRVPRVSDGSIVSITQLTSAIPSGVAKVRITWTMVVPQFLFPKNSSATLVLTCSHAKDSEVLDIIPLDVNMQGSLATHLPVIAGCDFQARILTGVTMDLFNSSVPSDSLSIVTENVTVIAQSELVSLLGSNTDPVGTRLSFGDTAGDVQITWTSLNDTAPTYVLVSTVTGGPYNLSFTATTAPLTYKAEDLCHAPANQSSIVSYIDPGFFHTVVVTGLIPGTVYYAIYGQQGGVPAPEITFRTRLPPGPDVPVRFAAFGDSATYPIFPGTTTTIDLVLAEHANEGLNFTAVIGDLGYAEGSTLVWALWSGLVYPVASAMPWQVTVGNHEVNTDYCSPTASAVALQSGWAGPSPVMNSYGDDSGGEGGYPTFARYRAPPSSSGYGVFWYSFEVGNVHYTYLSSEHDYITPGSAQRAWLEADFAAVNASITPWLIVALHRPIYNGYNDSDWDIAVAAAQVLEPLFVAAGVDLVLAGHYHNYLRTGSLRNFTVDPSGLSPVYITVGTGGATYHNESVRSDAADWTLATDAEWGFGIVETFNRSALRWTFRRNVDGGAIGDEVWIVREAKEEKGFPVLDNPLIGTSSTPQQIHLTLHPDPDTLVVTWTSFDASPSAIPIVQSGFAPSDLNVSSNGTVWTYTVDSCSNSTRTMHTVIFPAKRDQSTYYRCTGDGGVTWSAILGPIQAPGSLRPHQATPDEPLLSISLFGDLGINTSPYPNAVPALINDTIEGTHDMIIHFGDTAYNMNDGCGSNGDEFLNAAQSYASLTPVLWGNGNHETGPLYDYSEYLNRLAPGQSALATASNSSSPRWYSWEMPGVCAFFLIDTDAWIYPLVYPLASVQWEWLRSRLALVNRSITPWVVVIGHRAMYCTKTDDGECNSEAETLRYGQLEQYYGLESLLIEYGADFYFAGHTHHFENTFPVREALAMQTDYINPRGPIHIQSGIAGTGGSDPFAVPQQPWERFRDTNYSPSYGRLVFVNSTVAIYSQLFATNRSILDSFVVVQNNHGGF